MKIHIPTTQYGFIEAEVENAIQAHELHCEITEQFKEGCGLSDKQFNKVLDRYLTDGTGETQDYLDMNTEQKWLIQHIKRAYKRIGTLDDSNPI